MSLVSCWKYVAETGVLWMHETKALPPKSSLQCPESSGDCKCFLSSRKIFTENLWAPLRTKSWFLYTSTALTGLYCISFSCHHLPNLQSLETEIQQLQTPLWKTLVFQAWNLNYSIPGERFCIWIKNQHFILSLDHFIPCPSALCHLVSHIYIIYIYIKCSNLQLQWSGWGFGIVLKWKKKSYSLISSVCLKVFTNTRYMDLKLPLLLTHFFKFG